MGDSTFPLLSIVTIGLCAVACDADYFVSITQWANLKKELLSKFLYVSTDVHAQEQINAIFATTTPQEFEWWLVSWIKSLQEITAARIVALDGKTLRGVMR